MICDLSSGACYAWSDAHSCLLFGVGLCCYAVAVCLPCNARLQAKQMGFNCTSQRDQLYTPGTDKHGDYNPACTNSKELISPPLPIPPRPANCTFFFEDYFLGQLDEYTNSIKLDVMGKTWLLWNVTASGGITANMAYNGKANYLAFGIANPGGDHNGMNGTYALPLTTALHLTPVPSAQSWRRINIPSTTVI